MSDAKDNELHQLHSEDEVVELIKSSKKTRVISGLKPGLKRKTFGNTLKQLFTSGDFIVADDPNYKRKWALRILRVVLLLLVISFVGVFVSKIV